MVSTAVGKALRRAQRKLRRHMCRGSMRTPVFLPLGSYSRAHDAEDALNTTAHTTVHHGARMRSTRMSRPRGAQLLAARHVPARGNVLGEGGA